MLSPTCAKNRTGRGANIFKISYVTLTTLSRGRFVIPKLALPMPILKGNQKVRLMTGLRRGHFGVQNFQKELSLSSIVSELNLGAAVVTVLPWTCGKQPKMHAWTNVAQQDDTCRRQYHFIPTSRPTDSMNQRRPNDDR